MLRGGALTCTARGHPAAGASSLSWALPASAYPGGSTGSWAVSPAPWALGPALLDLRSQGRAAPSGGASARAASQLLPGPAGRAAAL